MNDQLLNKVIQYVHDDMLFTVSLKNLTDKSDIIGFYIDGVQHIREIHRESLYGVMILTFLKEQGVKIPRKKKV